MSSFNIEDTTRKRTFIIKVLTLNIQTSYVSLLFYLRCDSRDIATIVGDTMQVIENTYYHMFPEKSRTVKVSNKLKSRLKIIKA